MPETIVIRPVTQNDVPALAEILNALVRKGGTTSRRIEISEPEFTAKYLESREVISCLCAESSDGVLLGFQSLNHASHIPTDWGDIATFAKIGNSQKGIGRLLFQQTLEVAKTKQLQAINATIRSYNTGGLAYYSKMGFVEYQRRAAEPLVEGEPAEMIIKKRNV